MQPQQPPMQPYPPQQPYPPMPPYPPQQPQKPKNWFTSLSRPWQAGIGCLALIVVCGLCGAIGSLANGGNSSTSTSTGQVTQAPQATHVPTATPKPKQWHTVQHFTGNQNQQSETFHISSDQWRIVWSDKLNDAGGGSGLFNATLYTSDNQIVDLVANVANQSSGATYNAHVGPGDYYIKIEALYTDYDVQVQEYN